MQVVAPLLLIFRGYGALAGRRSAARCTSCCSRAQAAGRSRAESCWRWRPWRCWPLPVLLTALGYLACPALCVVLILLLSAMVRRRRDALLALIAIWAITVVLLPRASPDMANAAVPLRNRFQTDVQRSASC